MNAPHSIKSLPDIQGLSPDIALDIECVGIKGLRIRLSVPQPHGQLQQTIAVCSLGVNLPASKRGTHMSRFIETLNAWDNRLEESSLLELLSQLCARLEATCAMVEFAFPLFIPKSPPFGSIADMSYDCSLKAALNNGSLRITIFIEVPVMTVCPCSKAICAAGAHSQRAQVRMRLALSEFKGFNPYIKLAENSASSAVYTLLKRADEKFVTEQAFAQPAFVEDVVRKIAFLLEKEKQILEYEVEVESMESIHNHNAFAILHGSAKKMT